MESARRAPVVPPRRPPGSALPPLPPLPPPAPPQTGDLLRQIRFLGRVAVLRPVPAPLLETIARSLRPRFVSPGEVVCEQGQVGDEFFLIENGTFAVFARLGREDRELARLGPGESFGELALLGGGPRSATVRAMSPGRLWVLTATEFHRLRELSPELDGSIRALAQLRDNAATLERKQEQVASILAEKGQVRFGRSSDNDIVVDSLFVSGNHSVIEKVDGGFRIADLQSLNGTTVNGARVSGWVALKEGDEVVIGDQRFLFTAGAGPVRVVEGDGIRIDVLAVSKRVKAPKRAPIKGEINLLQDVSLTILPGEFVAIVGGSGAGKTTLLDVMSGVRPATGGRVLYNGRDYYENINQYRHTLGYVPQDDIIHRELPLGQTLRHSARLRLPHDTSDAEIDATLDQVITELGLADRREVRVLGLSGGQRKRASIAIELLTKPRVFFLDEPTSGLDPASDGQMMSVLRRLADDGRTVVLTTHATRHVMKCDRIVVLARGGFLAFVGTPADALRYFDVESFDEIYDRLEEGPPPEHARRFAESEWYTLMQAEQQTPASPHEVGDRAALGAQRHQGVRHQLHQFGALCRRNFDVARFPANFMPLVGQPIVFVLLSLALFRSNIFSPNFENPAASMILLYHLNFMCFLFGLLYGCQEIVKERSIWLRERMVNLGVAPYLLSKTSFLGPMLMLCIAIMLAILRVTNRIPAVDFGVMLKLYIGLVLTALAGLSMSLFISAVSKTSQGAVDLLTPTIGPQVLFAGELFAVTTMGWVGQQLAKITGVRWAFEASGKVLKLNDLFAASKSPTGQGLLTQYRSTFAGPVTQQWIVLGLFVVVPLVFAAIVLKRRSQAA